MKWICMTLAASLAGALSGIALFSRGDALAGVYWLIVGIYWLLRIREGEVKGHG